MADARTLQLLSVVAPVYDEEELDRGVPRARRAPRSPSIPFELVLVDDGSTDRTPAAARPLAARDPRVRVIHLSRNFGHQAALTAGLDHARGDVVVMIDADLQDPPELIPEMLDHWRAGLDVVYAVRQQREGETRFKLATARVVLQALRQARPGRRSSPTRATSACSTARRSTRCCSMRERNRFLRGMTVWVGYTQTAVPYERDARHAGETKYTLRQDAALLARRDLVVLAPAAAARDARRLPLGAASRSSRSRS